MVRLHDYQNEIVSRLSEEWRTCRSVMIQMPTGTGKTHVLAAVVKEVLAIGKGTVWIVAHRRELVAQIEETIGRYGINRTEGRVRSMSIQWLSRHWEEVEGEPELVIIDEAHHAVAETYKEMWNRWLGARFLGLTATPCRMNRRGFTDLFDTLITSWGIAEFIEKGFLSVFDYVSIRANSKEQRLIDSLEKRGTDGDYQVKEMDCLLNRHASIGQLYRSMERFAHGKKGIVYAVSIGHARNIAAYYNRKGVCTAAIDSHTPATERKRMVEDFKNGKIKVLVNVDIFSEGFDCPDVEFVQMARPTLSLSKYLQQVGRGLRKTEGKEACILIDNVGLYRLFGLPTVAWDWEAMFCGTMPGKGRPAASETCALSMLPEQFFETPASECDMEVVVSHEQLLTDMARLKEVRPFRVQDCCELKAWQDGESGLWGLRRGRKLVTDARFVTVFDIRYGMAAVRFRNNDCGWINDAGETVWSRNGCLSLRFMKNRLLQVTTNNREYYVDMYSLRIYERKPKVKTFGNVELLEIDNVYYSRTRKVYVNDQGVGRYFIKWKRFYLTVYDEKAPFPSYYKEHLPSASYIGHACILEGDNDAYYWLYYKLADGSIIVTDNDRRYYHVSEGKPKAYIGCRRSEEEWEACKAEIERMARLAEKEWKTSESERIEKRRQQLAQSEDAVPFRSGMRWGLRVGNRVTVPPIYRSIKSPVGKYCAVEKNYSQWGVVAVDGTVMVEPQYSDIEITLRGVVTGTKVTGNKERMKLP